MQHSIQWLLLVAVSICLCVSCGDDPEQSAPLGEDTIGASDTSSDTSSDTGDVQDDTTLPDTSADTTGDVVEEPPLTGHPENVFLFGVDPEQTVSAAPFPNDLYFKGGVLSIAPLGDDPVVSALGSAPALEMFSTQMQGRGGFGIGAPVFFFIPGEVDLDSLAGKVHMITLEGPEAGKVIATQLFYNPHTYALGVMPAWGEYTMQASTYGVLIEGGALTSGEAITAAPEFAAILAESPSDDPAVESARSLYAPLRDWVAAEGKGAGDFVVGAVFSTEEVISFGEQVFSGVDAFVLEAPTFRTGYDEESQSFTMGTPVEGADLDTYFGIAEAPFEYLPGDWGGYRPNTIYLEGYNQEYTGGSAHFQIGKVFNGSITAPAFNTVEVDGKMKPAGIRMVDGIASSDIRSLVPFILYLCDDHVADPSNVAISVFSHGGGSSRSRSLAFANVNCLSNIATIALDMPFHDGRSKGGYLAEDKLIVPLGVDEYNRYTGLSLGDPGFIPDQVGDNGAAAVSVGQLFGLTSGLNPEIIESNMIMVSAEVYTLVRLLKEGDWSNIQTGLSFDTSNMTHNSLSFGSSMLTPLHALRDDFRGIVNSSASGTLLGNIMMAPDNAGPASSLTQIVLGLASSTKELQALSQSDFVVSVDLWLSQRSDPLGYAPYILRHRLTDAPISLISSGNSWDEVLHNGLQMTYANALGNVHYQDGADWQLDPTALGAEYILSAAETLAPGEMVTENVSFNGRSYTAVDNFFGKSCHSHIAANLCLNNFEHPYPPITPLDTPTVFPSPLCELQHQIKDLNDSLLSGAPLATIGSPRGTCEDLYAP